MAVGAYDHVRDLCSGAIPVEGIELTTVNNPIEDILYRTHNHAEWHVTELGMGGYVARLARGEQPYVAIPVFTSRVFRHSCIYVHKGAGIKTPGDLNGKRIGMPEWGMAAAIWARGMLTDEYGLDQKSIHWVQGGLHEPGRVDRSPPAQKLGLDYQPAHERSLDSMLAAGEIDALFSARLPNSTGLLNSPVQRLFTDLQAEETSYWKRTGVFPIMHMMGIRRDVYEKNPWVVQETDRHFNHMRPSIAPQNSLRTTGISSQSHSGALVGSAAAKKVLCRRMISIAPGAPDTGTPRRAPASPLWPVTS